MGLCNHPLPSNLSLFSLPPSLPPSLSPPPSPLLPEWRWWETWMLVRVLSWVSSLTESWTTVEEQRDRNCSATSTRWRVGGHPVLAMTSWGSTRRVLWSTEQTAMVRTLHMCVNTEMLAENLGKATYVHVYTLIQEKPSKFVDKTF